MYSFDKIIINKNRGWRGLAEADCIKDGKTELKMIFSFSQPVWDDMQKGYMVLQDTNNYIVIRFNNTARLPKGQRSVLLKYFTADVIGAVIYPKNSWTQPALSHGHYDLISHFIKNRNNHTTYNWNCIGIRVVPMI